jgi:hypothetical protein
VQDRQVDARVLATLSFHDLVPTIWLPTPELRRERERSAGGCTWSSTARH